MTRIRKNWSADLPPIPEGELAEIGTLAAGEYYEVCACFWLFRVLHRAPSATGTLQGDYCFGRFSRHLAGLDSVELTDAFAEFLRRDTLQRQTLAQYLAFVKAAGGVLAP